MKTSTGARTHVCTHTHTQTMLPQSILQHLQLFNHFGTSQSENEHCRSKLLKECLMLQHRFSIMPFELTQWANLIQEAWYPIWQTKGRGYGAGLGFLVRLNSPESPAENEGQVYFHDHLLLKTFPLGRIQTLVLFQPRDFCDRQIFFFLTHLMA